MKQLFLVFALLGSVAFVQSAMAGQLELSLQHPDEVLAKAFPGDANTRVVEYEKIPAHVRKTLDHVDLPFEAGDGYYDAVAVAHYMVTDTSGHVVGYMEANLLSYTEDSTFTLAAAYVNTYGIRLEKEIGINIYSDLQEVAESLPPELQPTEEN